MNDLTLINQDCVAGLRGIEGGAVDLVVTSPPYDDLRKYDGFSFDFAATARELTRVLTPGGVIVWVVGDACQGGSETGTSFRQALFFKDECGLNLHDTMIYEKSGFAFPNPRRYHQVFEFMFVLSKGRPKTFNAIMDRRNLCAGAPIRGTERQRDGSLNKKSGAAAGRVTAPYGRRWNIWRYAAGWMKSTVDREAFQHPAIFPEKLAGDHILSWSNPGELVLDPFLGSGTTGKMARRYGRRFVGCEVSERYFGIAKRRIEGEITPAKSPPSHHASSACDLPSRAPSGGKLHSSAVSRHAAASRSSDL